MYRAQELKENAHIEGGKMLLLAYKGGGTVTFRYVSEELSISELSTICVLDSEQISSGGRFSSFPMALLPNSDLVRSGIDFSSS